MIAGCHWQSQSLRILVVENHADTLQCLADYLQAMGHGVTKAATTTQALESPALVLCDVLIADLRFPVGDGWELLRIIRLSRPIYAIAISGLGTRADRARSEAAGFQHHLPKPFLLGDLGAALEKAMSAIKSVAADRGDVRGQDSPGAAHELSLSRSIGGARMG